MNSRVKKPCPLCGELYYPLGIMRHRWSEQCKQNYRRKYGSEYDRIEVVRDGEKTYRYRRFKRLISRSEVPAAELKRMEGGE